MNINNHQQCMIEISKLKDNNMLQSSYMLCSLLLSSLLSSDSSNRLGCLSETLELMGDILQDKKEYKRAITFYKEAMTQRKYLSKSRTNTATNTIEEAKIKFKEGQCLLSIGDNNNALKELETVPSKLRDAQFHLCLGKLYKANNRKKDAITTFKEILRKIPSCIEAIDMLVGLGIDAIDITGIIDDSIRENHNHKIFEDGWLHTYILALSHKRNCDYEKSETQFNKLIKVYPKNILLLDQLGRVAVDAERNEDALILYKQIRRLDAGSIHGMEYYGQLLMNSSNAQELSKLAHAVIDLNQRSPIGWLLVAMYCEVKGESEKAISFIEKSIQLDSQNSFCYRLKGSLLLSHGSPDQAVMSFYQANAICHDTATYTGLINSQLAIGKSRDAMHAAKDALNNLPKSSNVHLIMADLLARVHEYDEAINHYTKALKLNPFNINAAASLSDVLMSQERYHEAATLLQNSLNRISCSRLRTQYAKVLVAMGQYNRAIEELHLAISLNTEDSTEATQELEKLDALLNNQKMEENTFEDD